MLTTSLPTAIAAFRKATPFLIFQGDCKKFLAELPPASVDLIVSSPPYFMGKEYDKSNRYEDFEREHLELVPLLSRALRNGGSLCWQTGVHARNSRVVPLDFLAYSAFAQDKSLFLRNRIIWQFEHGVHSRRRFSGRHETILWFTKGEEYVFDLDAVRIPQKYPGKRHYKGPNRGEYSGNPIGKNPGDVWEIPNVKANHREKTIHPCQFPVALPQRLIRCLTKPGAVVLDPYAGVSSTGVAAGLEGRRFAGCEIDRTYAETGLRRYEALKAGTLRVRDWAQPIEQPNPLRAVAQTPEGFRRDHDGAESTV